MNDQQAAQLVLSIHAAIVAAGIPILGVSLSAGNTLPVVVQYDRSATAGQITSGNAIAASFGSTPKLPRPLYAIYNDLQALTSTQKTNVWTDLSSGTPKKYLLDAGPNTAAIGALDWSVNNSGATGANLVAAELRIAAMYVQDNPYYLQQPSFDNSINILGVA